MNFYKFAADYASYCVHETILPVLIVSCKNNNLSLNGTEAWLIIDGILSIDMYQFVTHAVEQYVHSV